MSSKLTHKCDGCGVEVTDENDEMGGGLLGGGFIARLGQRRRGVERWGHLSLAPSDSLPPAVFDLCDACTKRVLDLLELELPKLETMLKRYGLGSNLGGHVSNVPFVPDDDFGPGDHMAPPWAPPAKPEKPPFGALTPDDLKALGIELPSGLMPQPTPMPHPSICASCGAAFKGPRPKICTMCGHVHD